MTNSNGFKFNRPDSPVTLAALDIHHSRGWGNFGGRPGERPPIPVTGKAPNAGPNWQNLRFDPDTDAEVIELFTSGLLAGVNLGVLLGNGLADVDLDCSEARRAVELVLTPTPRQHGRPSAPISHWWYRVDRDGVERYQDADGSTLLELRASTGLQTVVPPSIHPGTGEAIVWERPTDAEPPMPRDMELDVLGAETAALAVACVLGRGNRWPRKGGRHEAYLALVGGLLRGASRDAPRGDLLDHLIRTIVNALAYLTDDEEEQVRGDEAVRSTWDRLATGENVIGWTRLGELLNDDGKVTARQVVRTAMKHAATMRRYLELPYLNGDREAGSGERSNGNAAAPEEEEEEERHEITWRVKSERWWRAARRQVDDEEAARRETFDPGVLGAWEMFERYRESAGMHLVENTIPKRGIGSFFGESAGS